MASAQSLISTAVILNSEGLATNGNITEAITEFKNLNTVVTMANIFSTVYDFSMSANNDGGTLMDTISNVGIGATGNQWLLDLWPISQGASPSVSAPGALSYYGNTLPTVSYINAISTQSQLPFSGGYAGFANAFITAYGHATTIYDTVGSINILQNRTIGNSGIGFTSQTDIITSGLGNIGNLLANVVSTWGTTYDVTKLYNFHDPYVFGQNLLNQGLGSYGNLTTQLTAIGLDTTDITSIPPSSVTISPQLSSVTTTTPVGQVVHAIVGNVVTNTTVLANNPVALVTIYETITGSNLAIITNATKFTGASTVASVADLLSLEKIVDPKTYSELRQNDINSLSDLGNVLQRILGKGQSYFNSWNAISDVLKSIYIPELATQPATGSGTKVLPSWVSTQLLNSTTGGVIGSGPYGVPKINDFLGTCSGYKQSSAIGTLINGHATMMPSLLPKLNALSLAVNSYINNFIANIGPDIALVDSAVSTVNSTLSNLTHSVTSISSNVAYWESLTQLTTEVSALRRAGVTFGTAPNSNLLNFAKSVPVYCANDTMGLGVPEFFGNLITTDSNGDQIKLAIAEIHNNNVLASVGIQNTNDPQPMVAYSQSVSAGIPLSTYLDQNR